MIERTLRVLLFGLAVLPALQAWAEDWPQWRFNAGRTAASPERLAGRLWNGKPKANGNAGGVRGCNRALAGEHRALIRDGHASSFDLETHRQTLFRGVRAGCTNRLIPGCGLLNAPNFSHGCSCNYAVFGSLAFVHPPGIHSEP